MRLGREDGDYVLKIDVDEMITLRYALRRGVDDLGSEARWFEAMKAPDAASRFENYGKALALSVGIEKAIRARLGDWHVDPSHDQPGCAPAGGGCVCGRVRVRL